MHTLAALLLLAPVLRAAGVFLPAIFKDGMVLQTPADGGGAVAAIFGFAHPGEAVVVNMTLPGRTAPETFSTLADASTGKWSVNVSPTSGDLEPSDVTFSIAAASDASPTLIVNASFGEVILCNGQSNMVMSVAAATSPWGRAGPPSTVLQNSTWPLIRIFSVITADASTPQQDLPAYINRTATRCTWGWVNSSIPLPPQAMVCQTWQVAAPGVTDFVSAECFYTAHELMASGAIPGTQVEERCLIPGTHIVRPASPRSWAHGWPHPIGVFRNSDGDVGASRGIRRVPNNGLREDSAGARTHPQRDVVPLECNGESHCWLRSPGRASQSD